MIGDIHGMLATLEQLVAGLGYTKRAGRWAHPAGRRLVFVGDLIDRGPDSLGCLELAQEVHEQGMGLMVLGNHELNALHFLAEPPLRPRNPRTTKQFRATLDQIEADPARWERLVPFLRRLPPYLELDGGRLRVVHAQWHEESIKTLPLSLERDEDFLASAAHTALGEAFENCLKGCEEDCAPYDDHFGHRRTAKRVPWWRDHPATAPFTVFGHYWFPWPIDAEGTTPREPDLLGEGRNAACLDWCAGRGGPLVALRYPERTFTMQANRDL